MKEVYRSPDPVSLSFIRHRLAEEGIETLVLDAHAGDLFHGLAGIGPRLMVLDGDYEDAVRIIAAEGLAS